ncbi:hypothetical protein KAV79_06930 [Candidatus Aerophobetes bacterium]|nr:hypothetical protein [Candidatus Aerophobetes bacterium]
MPETGWIDDIFHDFIKDFTYHLEENLPHIAEKIAKEAERLANEEIQKQRAEILESIEKWLNDDFTKGEAYHGDPSIDYWIKERERWETLKDEK